MKKLNSLIISVIVCVFLFASCGELKETDENVRFLTSIKSEPIPENGTVFVGREYANNATIVVFYDDAAYVGYHKENEKNGYAEFQGRFARLTLAFDGRIFRITNASSLWASAWMHDSYPQGFVFNEDGSMSWVSPLSFSSYKGPSIKHDGIKWPVYGFTPLENIEVDKLENIPTNLKIENFILNFESKDSDVFIEQTGENEKTGFGTDAIDLTKWEFTSAGEYQFRLRSLGGFPTYDENGYLKKLTVSSDLSASYVNFVVALGARLATPNLRIVRHDYFPNLIVMEWDPVPNADWYSFLKEREIGTSGSTLTITHLGSLPDTVDPYNNKNLSVGTHTYTVTAESFQRTVIDEMITFFPSSEMASLTLTINRNGTFSYK